MGLLDDAIREHLDLKRRRGSDPEEIERLEREALGPVRRAPEATDHLIEEDPAAVAYEPAPAALHDEEYEEHPDDADWHHEEPEVAQAALESPAAAAGGGVAEHPPVPAAPREPEPDVGGETVEYDVEAEHAAIAREGEEPKADDVLEETPEFLQDTPDHDRLWFEQRPPKDFDFDG